MITPRRTRLIRVPDLRAFQRVIAALVAGPALEEVRGCAVLVPSRGAARQLRRTIENVVLGLSPGADEAPDRPRALLLPDLLTRDDWYEHLRQRLPDPPRRLDGFEREVILAAAARQAGDDGAPPPFALRPGLIAAMLDLYDQLRRRQETVEAFDRVLSGELLKDESDRGAERLLRQTRFLTATYRHYEARVAASGAVDEHGLRERLIAEPARDPLRRVVATTGDWIGEMPGLWKADFDLLTRLPGLEAIDVVATSELLASGFHERIHEWLPDLEEVEGRTIVALPAAPPPVLVTPPEAATRGRAFLSRDREEELMALARRLKGARRGMGAAGAAGEVPPALLDRTAVVFRRPLPYIYLAHGVFGSSGIPYQTLDALPLAAEPYAAALDLVFAFVTAEYTRETTIALLRSPHFRFEVGGHPVGRGAVAALDRWFSERRYLGGLAALERLADAGAGEPPPGSGEVARAWQAARDAAAALDPLRRAAPGSAHCRRLLEFLSAHDRPPRPDDPLRERRLRTRAAILAAIEALTHACAEYDDRSDTIEPLAATIRRWIEGQTFAPGTGRHGLHLLDAHAARYADVDEIHIVGLVEGEWPERPPRNIFYPLSLLGQLRWPSEKDRLSAARAAFHDLLRLPRAQVSVSAFRLEDDAIVEPSVFVDELSDAGLPVVEAAAPGPVRIFPDEALAGEPGATDIGRVGDAWLARRRARDGFDAPSFHGEADPPAPRPYSVSRIELYLSCPFKYFAQVVLRLEEEPEDEDVLAPRTQGRIVHEVFQIFYDRWAAGGGGAVTAGMLEAARALFAQVVDERLAVLPETDATFLRARLLGTAARTGAGDAVFLMEARRDVAVVRRLLEYPLEGEFVFGTAARSARRVALRGYADRVDLLEDGTFRLIDYKLSRAPATNRALQLPVYSLCIEQALAGAPDGPWRLGEAAYLAFGGARQAAPPLAANKRDLPRKLEEAQDRLLQAVEGIERGDFPPRPAELRLCTTCAYASICRKDYVTDGDGDEDD
ncbi:MAG TPA: PD-(D/E)XK nuclease family protein [Vicinamibacterales bacterium]|nr:PD-(D/E)XK nuclease family protein [Vicinamibacterales bacterium]